MTARPPPVVVAAGAPPARPFSAVGRARLYEEVAARIQDLIATGELKPGDKLPPERELIRRFEVSRSSIREAMRTLELMGLVRTRQGEGTTVRDVSADALAVPLSTVLVRHHALVAEILEARRMLEPPIAALAAAHATEEEIADLEDLLRRQHGRMLRQERAVEEDTEFHYRIALAARNGVVRQVVNLLMQLLTESRARSHDVPGRLERSYAGHRRIVRAIARRDARGAERAMRRHLAEIEQLILKGIQS
jgi:GntR family transcriptional regulator, transcriptional repressor for pyruvate dehydrogenase complex